MKTAIYIENGRTQIILTPEDDFEKNIINSVKEKQVEIASFTGTFSECIGGFIRQYNNKQSLMLLLKEKE
jgi:predicted DNA-binding protein with PD1-like motif